jgi:hypothetical protein
MTEQKFSIFWFSLRIVQWGCCLYLAALFLTGGLLELRHLLTGERKSFCDLYPNVFICSQPK